MTDFYQSLRARIHAWAKTKTGRQNKWLDYILLAPDFFHVLIRLVADRRVSWKSKAMLGGVIAYFVSPLDIIPEGFVGPVGYLDDVALAALAIQQVLKSAGPAVVRAHWAGDGDVLTQVSHVLDAAEEMIGPPRWEKLLEVFRNIGEKENPNLREKGRPRARVAIARVFGASYAKTSFFVLPRISSNVASSFFIVAA